jgi:hypothetical protein
MVCEPHDLLAQRARSLRAGEARRALEEYARRRAVTRAGTASLIAGEFPALIVQAKAAGLGETEIVALAAGKT